MEEAIRLAMENVSKRRGGPFGALIVQNGELIATGANCVTTTNDPTAHAEMVVIRAAGQRLATFQLTGCELYSTCEPCPMCLGAIYWARLRVFYYSATREQAAAAGFSDAYIYDQIPLPPSQRSIPSYCLTPEWGQRPFVEWAKLPDRISY
jgi:guanine deaminase